MCRHLEEMHSDCLTPDEVEAPRRMAYLTSLREMTVIDGANDLAGKACRRWRELWSQLVSALPVGATSP